VNSDVRVIDLGLRLKDIKRWKLQSEKVEYKSNTKGGFKMTHNPGDIRAEIISGEQFWKTVVVGLIATFTMTMTGFWQSGLGLAAIDVGAMITGSMTAAHPDAPYTLVAGNLVHFANGVMLALVWVAFLQKRVPGNWIVQGLIYAFLTTLAAWVVVAPLAFGVGLFFANTPAPGRMMLATAAVHVAYGVTLTLGLKVAGVRAART
jgi:hypothetical protein